MGLGMDELIELLRRIDANLEIMAGDIKRRKSCGNRPNKPKNRTEDEAVMALFDLKPVMFHRDAYMALKRRSPFRGREDCWKDSQKAVQRAIDSGLLVREGINIRKA